MLVAASIPTKTGVLTLSRTWLRYSSLLASMPVNKRMRQGRVAEAKGEFLGVRSRQGACGVIPPSQP